LGNGPLAQKGICLNRSRKGQRGLEKRLMTRSDTYARTQTIQRGGVQRRKYLAGTKGEKHRR